MSVVEVEIKKEADIDGLIGGELVRFYNQVAKKPTKKFSDRKSGLKRAKAAWVEAGSKAITFEQYISEEKPGKVTKSATKPATKPAKVTNVNVTVKVDKPAKPAKKEPVKKGKGSRVHQPFNYPVGGEIKEHREGTNRANIIALLSRKNGAKIHEITKITGWTERNAYDGIRMLHVQVGYGITEDLEGNIKLVSE